MIDTFFGAKLVDYNTIRIAIFSSVNKSKNVPFQLIIDGKYKEDLLIVKQSFLNGLCLFECRPSTPIELGKNYIIQCRDFGSASLNVNDATSFPDFDKDYYYDGDDLGFSYTKEATTFKVWAPLASKVSLFIRKTKDDTFITYKMKREDKGVYSITLVGDYEGYFYRYQITNSGLSFITTDPYGKASSANGKDSAVIDFSKTKIDLNESTLPIYKRYIETIIYELNVRDFTIDDSTTIVNKGKFLGLAEEGKETLKQNPAGLDYLKEIGITHVQLMPIYDFKTVDELNPDKTYNRGYDPQQYFVPEGSYSTNPNDPYSRIIELKTMISTLHKANIKVNMDVVFNHVYNYEFSVFEKVVPNYYFRKNKNGTLCNGSGCGNDLATERPMVRKLIIDCLTYWMKEYGIDGYRFDLMGLIDIDTMNKIVKVCKSIKEDAMIYGEGWDMNTNLPQDKKTSILNSFKNKDIAYFNDTFRDITRGNNDLNYSYGGYLLGDISYREGFKYAYMGSSVNYLYAPRFSNANQSINYVECHDNCTLYDKISKTLKTDDSKRILAIIKSINLIILYANGVPFIHSGQEIGLSKKMKDNTYNLGDEFNKFNYRVLDERLDSYLYFKSIVMSKKEHIKKGLIRSEPEDILNAKSFIDLPNGGLMIKSEYIEEGKKIGFIVVINPSDKCLNVSFDDYYKLVIGDGGYLKGSDIYVQNGVISPHRVDAFIKK